MNTLRKGSRGPIVKSLQLWFSNFEPCLVDGSFGPQCVRIAKKLQKKFGLVADGVVGPRTAARFMTEGWLPAGFDQPHEAVSPFPNKPSAFKVLNQVQKVSKFGSPGSPAAKPTPGGPIKLDKTFARQLVLVDLREWFPNIGGAKRLQVHGKVQKQWRAAFDEIKKKGLGSHLLTCAGSFNPRYIRGSTTHFSSHAFATAIDFNAPQNGLGAEPAHKGEKGSVVALIPIFARRKIWWGGWFTRADGMHFESTSTDDELGL